MSKRQKAAAFDKPEAADSRLALLKQRQSAVRCVWEN
jgi:hypothetical protein